MKVNILVPFLNNFGEKGFYQSQELGLAYAFFNAGIDVTVYKCVKNEIAGIDTPFPVIYKKVNFIINEPINKNNAFKVFFSRLKAFFSNKDKEKLKLN